MKSVLQFLTILIVAANIALPQIPSNYAILDNTNSISSSTVSHVMFGNEELYFDTGGEIFFYIINFLPADSIEAYAMDVFNHWQLGRSDTNNGILVVVAMAQGEYWAVVGEGLHRHMPAAVLGDFFENYFVEYFQAGDVNAAVISLYDALSARVYQLFPPLFHRYEVATPTEQPNTTSPFGPFIAILVIVILVALLSRGGRGRGMGGHMMPRRRGFGMGGFGWGFLLGRGSARRRPQTDRPPSGGVYRPPSTPSAGGTPRRPGAGGYGGYGRGRGGYTRGGGGGISRGGIGRRR